MSFINNAGYVISMMYSQKDRHQTEQLLTNTGWTCDDFRDRVIWHKSDTKGIMLKLQEIPDMPEDEKIRKLTEFGVK